jgi:LytS/YehU family sensor histidine kinase
VDRLKLKTDNHFVFNSLATLGSLIETDPAAATAFNDSMCRMYRYIVSKGDARVVPLREELGFVEEYAKNLTLRHSHVHIRVEGAPGPADAMIPPLALQGLIENALKHNASGADRPLDIQLRIDNDTVTVSNNVQPLANAIPTTGSGLQTLSERYRLICGKVISVHATETRFSVCLPVIKSTDLYDSLDH